MELFKKKNMFEKKFLAYLLYITLVEIRESAYEANNSRLFHLSDMLHNTPLSLLDDESAKAEYNRILETVAHLGVSQWLENRLVEFKDRFPEFSRLKNFSYLLCRFDLSQIRFRRYWAAMASIIQNRMISNIKSVSPISYNKYKNGKNFYTINYL